MKVQELKCATLGEIDSGAPARKFDRELGRALSNLYECPETEKPRKVILELHLVPISEGGELTDVAVTIRVKSVLPLTVNQYLMKPRQVRGQIMLAFDPDEVDPAYKEVDPADEEAA